MDDPLLSGGPSPLEVLLTVMREKFAAGEQEDAAKFARFAAPYVHAKATRPAYKETSAMTDAELLQAAANIARAHGSHS